jgi:hypothetical protein
VDDVVEIVAAAVTADVVGQVVNVGGGSPATLLEAVSLLEEISGKALPKTFLERPKGDVLATRADVSKLERLFGVRLRTPLREGLAREWEWMKKFVEGEDEEQAIKSDVKIIVGVDEAVLAESKADAKASKKAKRDEEKRAKAQAKSKSPSETSEESPS